MIIFVTAHKERIALWAILSCLNYCIMNQEFELNKWWASLPVSYKEKISEKAYPECSFWWKTLSIAEQTDYYLAGPKVSDRQQ